ncbi:MAG TPA: hypothetical protein PKA10_05230 [Selenomonadales bacterium]|nr:hypothetical protein [Selenomonadales bacterium]
MSKEYRFWNGKNLNGQQEYAHFANDCPDGEFPCVVGTETVAGEDL